MNFPSGHLLTTAKEKFCSTWDAGRLARQPSTLLRWPEMTKQIRIIQKDREALSPSRLPLNNVDPLWRKPQMKTSVPGGLVDVTW